MLGLEGLVGAWSFEFAVTFACRDVGLGAAKGLLCHSVLTSVRVLLSYTHFTRHDLKTIMPFVGFF